MKYLNKSIYAFALAGMMGLWSCSQEDLLQGGDVTAPAGHPVKVTLTVSRSEAQTRTALEEVDVEGGVGLYSQWKETDKLKVMVKGQGIVGTLDFHEFPDESHKEKAVFSGDVTLSEGLNENVVVYYCDENIANVTGNQIVKVSLNNQAFHSPEELAKMDMLRMKINVDVKDGLANVTQNEKMGAHFAMAHFSLDLPDGVEGTLFVSDNGPNKPIYDLATINTYSYGVNWGFEWSSGAELIEISAEVKADHQVYMALPANYNERPYKVKLAFRFVSTEGDVYTYAFENNTEVTAGVYYCGEKDPKTGKSTGVEIPLELEEDSRNPLTKWAKTNLERVSDTEFYKGKFAASYSDNGHYYQFGRNVGFVDYLEASDCALVYSNAEEVSAGRGDGSIYDPDGGYYNASNLTIGERTNGYMIPCYNDAKDWWPSTNSRSDNWDARATASGYTASDLYIIDGVKYKVPSIADFQEILPTTTTSALTSKTEVKTINGNFVAFRWKKIKENDAYYLQIKAKVVGSKNESVSWDSTTDKKIVTRYFKAAGFIYPKYFVNGVWSKILNMKGDVDYCWSGEKSDYQFKNLGYQYDGLFYAACATPFGDNAVEMKIVSKDGKMDIYDDYTEVETVDILDVKINVTSNLNKYCGRYWASDGDRQVMSFIFDDDSLVGVNQFQMASTNASAYSVRLIKAE